MKKIKLGPCPFCGGKAIFESTRAEAAALNVRFQFVVRCQKCKAALPGAYDTELILRQDGEIVCARDDREKAASAWNQRYSGDTTTDVEEEPI